MSPDAIKKRLQEIVRQHRIYWQVWPEIAYLRGRRQQVGFRLELCGAHPPGCDATPGCKKCQELYLRLKEIADWITPAEKRDSDYTVLSFDSAIHQGASGLNLPDVILPLLILHRRNYEDPVDACEVRCLKEMKERLRELGAKDYRPKTKREAAGLLEHAKVAMLLLSLSMSASASTQFSFSARHDHALGSCRGTLTVGEREMRYEGGPHMMAWKYDEIQQLRLLESGRIHLRSYDDQPKWRLGSDRAFQFEVEGNLKEAREFLILRLDERLVLGLAYQTENVIAAFPVKHLEVFGGGSDGNLTFGEDTVVFWSEKKDESRTWRYSDVESISSSGPLQFTINTYERQKFQYATRRPFNFQLKRPLREESYNRLWRRLNRPRDLEIFEKLRSDVDARTEAPPAEPSPESAPINTPEESRSDGQAAPLKRILADEGLPAELIGVVKVESNFNRLALSPKNARGLWQFIPATARRYGLRVDQTVDERIDPEKSTRAAARYLRDLYSLFGDWKLALAGYNAGENRVLAALARSGAASFSEIASFLPRETQMYVPSVLASMHGPLTGGSSSAGYRLFAATALTQSTR